MSIAWRRSHTLISASFLPSAGQYSEEVCIYLWPSWLPERWKRPRSVDVTWSALGPTLLLRVLIWLPSFPDQARSRLLPFACACVSTADMSAFTVRPCTAVSPACFMP